MTHKLTAILIAMILTSSIASASGLHVAGVYYDPSQAEQGGEAILLVNDGSSPTPLDSVTLATKQSAFTLPSATLLPGQGYLIADTGWSTLRDNLSWPLADWETSLSLANTEGFVELQVAGSVIDHLAWNASNGSKAREGYMWSAVGEIIPWFVNSNTTVSTLDATLTVLDGPPVIQTVRVTDDSPTQGVQLLSYARTIDVQVDVLDPNGDQVAVTIDFNGVQQNMSALQNATNGSNTTTYAGTIAMPSMAPGTYALVVTARDGAAQSSTTILVTVLSTTSITTSGSLAWSGLPGDVVQGSFTVLNEGNTNKTVQIDQAIPGVACDVSSVALAPGESQLVTCTATIPNAAPATYTYIVKLIAS